MRRFAMLGMFMIVPAVLALSVAPGCTKKEKTTPPSKSGSEDSGKPSPSSEGKKSGAGKEVLKASLDATVTGQVTYAGDPPAMPFEEGIKANQNKEECMKGDESETHKQQWIVNKSNKGVANVVVWLQAPAGKYFDVRSEDRKRTDMVKLRQPHCAFIPHVIAMFPEYYDGTSKRVPTGQKLVVLNDAKVPHNTKIAGDGINNQTLNPTLAPDTKQEFDIKFQKEPLQVACNFHPWMNGYIWTFDNPYHAVTGSDGSFTIENVPSGVELTVVAWHEVPQKFKTEKKTFSAGKNTVSFTVSK